MCLLHVHGAATEGFLTDGLPDLCANIKPEMGDWLEQFLHHVCVTPAPKPRALLSPEHLADCSQV